MNRILKQIGAPLSAAARGAAFVLSGACALAACGSSTGGASTGGSSTSGASTGGASTGGGSAGTLSSSGGSGPSGGGSQNQGAAGSSGGATGTVAGASSSAAGSSGAGGNSATSGGTAGASAGGLGGSSGGATAGTAGMVGAAGSGGGGCADLGGGPITTTTTHLDIAVHDPSMIWSGTKYYLFATGGTLNIRSSANMQQWSNVGNVFNAIPAWITTALGANPGSLWAPDISYFNCAFHVYYAGSTFGSNTSVIGLATSPTLDSTSSSYTWTDQGVVTSTKSSDNYNAIDPNVSYDATGQPWLAFGSFWSGIKMLKLDVTSGKPSTSDTTLYSLASRNGGAIEAASIISHNGFYYLFVSFDACCKGVNSTYRTMVGRASAITGPYTDKSGAAMMQGAAEQLLTTSGRYIGPGGGTAFQNGTNYLYAYHYYDGDDNGNSKLQVRPITFDSTDWITLGDPLFP